MENNNSQENRILEDKKLAALISILETRKVISAEDANMIMALEPFPQGR